jgi:hypothetical protein
MLDASVQCSNAQVFASRQQTEVNCLFILEYLASGDFLDWNLRYINGGFDKSPPKGTLSREKFVK